MMTKIHDTFPPARDRKDDELFFPSFLIFNQEFIVDCLMPEVKVHDFATGREVHKFQCVFCKECYKGRNKKGNKIINNLYKHFTSCLKRSQKIFIQHAMAHLQYVMNRPDTFHNEVKLSVEKAKIDLDARNEELCEDFLVEFEKIDFEKVEMVNSDHVTVQGSFNDITAKTLPRYVCVNYFLPPGTQIKGQLPSASDVLDDNVKEELTLIVPKITEESFKIVQTVDDRELIAGESLSDIVTLYQEMVNLQRTAKLRKDKWTVDFGKLPELFNFKEIPFEIWHPLYKWTKKPRFKVEDVVESYYAGYRRCFPGKIIDVSTVERLYTIEYEDHDVETLVPENRIFFPEEKFVIEDKLMKFTEEDKKFLKYRTELEEKVVNNLKSGTPKSRKKMKRDDSNVKPKKPLKEKIYDLVEKTAKRLDYPDVYGLKLEDILSAEDFAEYNETYFNAVRSKLEENLKGKVWADDGMIYMQFKKR